MKRKARVFAGLLAVASMLALTGCSVRAQTAFTVDGEVTTVAQVKDMVDGCAAAVPPAMSASDMADNMIVAQVSRAMARDQDVQTSDADLTAMIQNGMINGLPPAVLNDPTCAGLGVDLALQALLVFQMGGPAYLAAVQDHSIVVNPRFGTLNPDDLTLTGSGSLSQAFQR